MTMTFRSTITSNQRAFNAVCRHLSQQKRRARTRLTAPESPPAYACEYFNARTGHLCAIGALLTQASAQHAEQHHSGEGIASIREFIQPSQDQLDLSTELLENLQTAHDESDTLTELHNTLHQIAAQYELNPAAITTITSWENTI